MKAYCIKDDEGDLLLWTIRRGKSNSIRIFEISIPSQYRWKRFKKNGWSCVKIEITEL